VTAASLAPPTFFGGARTVEMHSKLSRKGEKRSAKPSSARNPLAAETLQISCFRMKDLQVNTCAKLLNTGSLFSEMGEGARGIYQNANTLPTR